MEHQGIRAICQRLSCSSTTFYDYLRYCDLPVRRRIAGPAGHLRRMWCLDESLAVAWLLAMAKRSRADYLAERETRQRRRQQGLAAAKSVGAA